ncbi:MAG: hypothetical protein JW973_02025 [Bacteroidales bacterium]|nr:hypothetical protein [Bacteroidales bacterium]
MKILSHIRNNGSFMMFAGFILININNAYAAPSSDAPFDTARIYHAMAKARRGEAITVGVMGGSITAGSLASTEEKRWANLVTAWWRSQFPSSEVTLVNAGIGATGSDIGTFRIQKDMLQKDPDFVVVEFSVNDSGEDSVYVRKMMEGVVRQLLADFNMPGIMLLLLKMEDGSTAQYDHKIIGNYYQIPWVSQADLIGPALIEDGLVLSDVYGDTPNGIHPNDLGMQYIADFITERLDSIYAHLPGDEALPEISMILPDPLVTDVFACTYTFTASTLIPSVNKGWNAGATQWTANTPGAELVFTLDGNAIAVKYDKVFSTNRGRAEVWVDDNPHKIIDAFFTETWGTKPCFELVADNLPDGEHLLHIRILEEHNPLSNGNYVPILSVYKAGNITSAPPIAVPGSPKKELVNISVILDGSLSYDPDGDTITTYQWMVQSAPSGSTTAIENDSACITSFTPDLAGYYTIGLKVTGLLQESVVRSFFIHVVASNTIPVADAGEDIILATGKRVKPDGSNSYDADGDPLSYEWSILSQPEGSSALLYQGNTPTPYFFANVQGEYVVILVVNDSLASSSADTIKVTAIDGYTASPRVETDKADVRVYPNPADNILTIQYHLTCTMPVQIRLFSPEGHTLSEPLNCIQKDGLHELKLNLGSLSHTGKVMILQVKTGNTIYNQKIVTF